MVWRGLMFENSRLQKSVAVHAHNRPIKIAYFVPVSEETRSHFILDAIFHESYTRWGGANTLLIPTTPNQFSDSQYEIWLQHFDPDFIYSYVPLEQDFVKKIDSICLPISFLLHETPPGSTPEKRWRDLTPDWTHYFKSVKSLSTLLSPYANSKKFNRPIASSLKTLLTQSIDVTKDRFFPDNFGVSHDVDLVTNEVPGLYETLCYIAPKDPNSRMIYGSKEVGSKPDILAELATGAVNTFAQLSRLHSEHLSGVEPRSWGRGFLLFIGESAKDRLNFWNSRLLVPRWVDNLGSLIVKKEDLDDESFVKALSNYFNWVNFSRSNSQPLVELHSLSESHDTLELISKKFQGKTWSQFSIPNNFSSLACPSENEIKYDGRFPQKSTVSYRLTESENEIQASTPAHFEYNLGIFSHLNNGTWAIDLNIERHNNLSKYSNVSDTWQLPRRLTACLAFTNLKSKVTKNNLLTVIPTGQNDYLSHQTGRLSYSLNLPSDALFFHNLIAGRIQHSQKDFRHNLKKPHYIDLAHSDKGQNLRGVISMFERFEDSYKLLTNKLWRDALRRFVREDDSNSQNDSAQLKQTARFETASFTEDQLSGLLPNNFKVKEEYANKIQIPVKTATKYLKDALSDSLEYLVERNVLFQVYEKRCGYCGHINILTIDELKKENSCSICRTNYFAPIHIDWKFKFNEFVTRSLVVNNGLTVLWALGRLHQVLTRGSFFYLPEVNLFYEHAGKENREEIDILSVSNGSFIAGEVKKTATSFLRKDGEIGKFINKIKALNPDIALLVFEDLTDKEDEKELIKKELIELRKSIQEQLYMPPKSVKIVVGSDDPEFNKYDQDLGITGPRLKKLIFQE